MTGLSRETLELFRELLGQVSVSVSHPDFEEQSRKAAQAKRELEAALEE